MDYNYVENLVCSAKNEDKKSKEKLIEEFRPFILNLSKRTFIYGYEFDDIVNECYRILFRCVSLYKIETHRFVAYATNGIKNSINDLIKSNLKNNKISGTAALTIDNYIEDTCSADIPKLEDILCDKYDRSCLKYALDHLTEEELELTKHLFFKNNTLKSYAEQKEVSYSYAMKKKRYVLDKLYMYINIYINPKCIEKP